MYTKMVVKMRAAYIFLIVTMLLINSFITTIEGDPSRLTSKFSLNPSSTIDDNGNIYIVWQGYNGDEGIYYKYYDTSTSTWSSDIKIIDGNCEKPKILVDNGIYLAWRNITSNKVYLAKINIDGSFASQVIEVPHSEDTRNISMYKEEDELYFLLQKNDNIFYEKVNLSLIKWFDDRSIQNYSSNPIILYDDSLVHMLFTSNVNGTNDIYYYPVHPWDVKTGYDSDGDGLYDSVERGWTNYTNTSYDDTDTSTTTDENNIDSDNDGLPDGWIDGWGYNGNNWGVNYSSRDNVKQPWEGEDLDLDGCVDTDETNPNDNDTDDDGLPDGWERWFGLNPLDNSDAFGDPDNDGLTNLEEYQNNTSPISNDTDNDGILDRYEILHGLNPIDSDSDDDGLLDGEENLTSDIDNDGLISPLDSDSDNDSVIDGKEYYTGYTPFDDTDNDGLLNMLDNDSDNDGLLDGVEFINGTKPWRPVSFDSDNDGLSDYVEVNGNDYGSYGLKTTDPDNPDTDGDGIWDGNYTIRMNPNTNRLENYSFGELSLGLNPLDRDSDNDTLTDYLEVFGWNITVASYSNGSFVYHVTSNPLVEDSDGDGLTDYYEYQHGFNPSSDDTDGDSISDYNEINLSIDPLDPDIDDDGVYDGVELTRGTNLSDPDTDNDGLPDSEGDWISFRTNARDVNNGSVIREEFEGDTLEGDAFYDYVELRYSASHIINVTIYYTEGIRIRLQEKPLNSILNETEYWWWNASEYANHSGDGYTAFLKTGYNLTKCPNNSNLDNLEVNYSADYGGGSIFNKTGYITNGEVIPINNGSTWYGTDFKVGDPWGSYTVIEIYNVTLMKCNHTRKQLFETSNYPNDYDHFNYSSSENKIIMKHNLSNPTVRVVVYYVASDAIDYSAPENNDSWVAIDTSFYLIDRNLEPFGRIDGLTLNDEQINKQHQITKTPEGYGVYYSDKPTLYSIETPYAGMIDLNAVAWKPDGSYALIAGEQGRAYLYYRDGSTTSITLPITVNINSISWDKSGEYALLVGDNGVIYKFNSTSMHMTPISSSTSKNLSGVAFRKYSYDSPFDEYAVVVGDGIILSVNVENGLVTNITRDNPPGSLGGPNYIYRDVSHIFDEHFLITTEEGNAFVYDVSGTFAGFNKEFFLSPIPNRLIACDWKRSFDRTLNKFIDLGVIVGQRFVEVNGAPQPQWDIYTIDFYGNYNDYPGPILPPSSSFMFTDVRWHPILPEIIVTAKNSNTDYGYIYTLNLKTGYVNKTLSCSTLLNGIDYEPDGDYAIVVGHGEGGTTPIPMILGYIYPYVAIDTSGSYNPVYGSRWLYGTTGEARYAEVGRGSILYRFNAGQETKNNLMTTDPLNPSTFNDGLLDGYRLKLGFQDTDGDVTPNFLDNDADNDGIPNGEEAYFFSDFDNDSLINALDVDSDNDSISDGQEVKVVFRTNAVNDVYTSSTWIGVETDSSNNVLEGYQYSGNVTIDASSLQPVNYTLLGVSTQIHTPRGYLVYKDNNGYAYIDIPGPNMIKFSTGSIANNSLSLNSSYASQHKETYNCTGMLSDDADNDGLPDTIDPYPSDPDVDDDGIKDGYEINWNESIDDDGLPNYNDVDSDNDGLPDGWIDGWGYNATAAELHIHADGTIDGWGRWYDQDGIKQPWEGEDLNLNSMVDENETNPINSDTDNDNFLDGEEIAIYGTNPVTGWDYDGDGLSDYDELYGFYPIDIVNIVEYMNTSRDSIAKLDQDGWYGPAGWYGIANNDIIPIKLPFNTTYHIWTEPTGSTITINGTTFEDASKSNPAEISLEPGIYNISFTSTSFISKLFIAKRGCNISNPDTDNDGIPDGYEIGSPLDRDSDNDGLLDSEEQIPMYIERLVPNGGNPYYEKVYGGSFTISSPMRKDSDNDGLSDKYDPCRMEYETMGFPHSLYPPYSIVENRTFRGWGLNGHSWIIHRDGSIDDRGTTDVKVSNMSDLDEVRENIIKILPKWYDIPPSYTLPYTPLNNLGDALNGTYYNETWETYDFTGYPIFRINYTYQANLYNVTIYNNRSVYRYANGEIGVDTQGNHSHYHRYAIVDANIKMNRTQFIIIKFVVNDNDIDYYFNNESSYKLPVFEYKIYKDRATGWYFDKENVYCQDDWCNGNIDFETYPMQHLFLLREGYVAPVEIEHNIRETAYSLKIPISKEVSNESSIVHIYLSPAYVVKNGSCSKDKNIIPWELDNMVIAGIERILPEYHYKVISKLTKNITAIDSNLPQNIQNYTTGNYTIGGYSIYLYNGDPDSFSFNPYMLSKDAIIIISDTIQDVDKIVSSINFTSEWYYNTTNIFNESIKMKEFKSIDENLHHIYHTVLSDLTSWSQWVVAEYSGLHIDRNTTTVTKHNNTVFNYTVSYSRYIFDGNQRMERIHTVRDQIENLSDVTTLQNNEYTHIKNIFKDKSDGSILSTDSDLIVTLIPNSRPDGSKYLETFSEVLSWASWGYSLTSGSYGLLKTVRDLREINRIVDPIKKAEKIKDFMTPEVGKAEIADIAFLGLDFLLTLSTAVASNDKFVERAAGEHMVGIGIDASLTAAGIAFPPAGVVGITWTATYYAMVGGITILGIEKSPYLEYASDPGDAIVFAFIVFTGTTMPAEFQKEAFEDAEETILTYYMNYTKFLNRREVYDEECNCWYIIEPYYPQFYLDPR